MDDEVKLTVKMSRTMRDTFVKVCRDNDSNANREVREFIRRYIAKNSQKELFK